jgi:hypothetical protein
VSLAIHIDLLQDRHRLGKLGHGLGGRRGLPLVQVVVLMAVKVLAMSVLVPGQKE